MLNESEKGALVAPFLIAEGGIDNLQSEGDIMAADATLPRPGDRVWKAKGRSPMCVNSLLDAARYSAGHARALLLS
jgi:hypothetical protein